MKREERSGRQTLTCSRILPALSQMSSYWTVLLNNALTLDGLCTHCSSLCPLSLLPNPWNTHDNSSLETRPFPHLQYKVLTLLSLSLSLFLSSNTSFSSSPFLLQYFPISAPPLPSPSSSSSSLCSTTVLPSWPQPLRRPLCSIAPNIPLPPFLPSVTHSQHLEER